MFGYRPRLLTSCALSPGSIHLVPLTSDVVSSTIAVEAGPVLDMCAPDGESGLLLISADNKVMIVNVDSAAVCHLVVDGLHAEVLRLGENRAFIGGCGDESGGVLISIQFQIDEMDSLLYCSESEDVEAVWATTHEHAVCALAVDPSSDTRIAAACGSKCSLFDGNTGAVLFSFFVGGVVFALSFSANANWLVASGSEVDPLCSPIFSTAGFASLCMCVTACDEINIVALT